MTAFVDEAAVRAAHARAVVTQRLGAADTQRWKEVLAYAAARPSDPTPGRARVLRGLLGGTSDEDVLSRAGAVLAADVAGSADDRTLAAAVYGHCRRWFHEDVEAAAPLLELFTGHHRDPAGGPPPPDPVLIDRLQQWLRTKVGTDVVVEDATVISGGFSRLMLDLKWTSGRGVVRIEQDGMFGTEGRREVAVMRAMQRHGYPVPTVLWEEPDPAVIGHPFFVMEYVAGAARTDDAGLDDMLRAVSGLHKLGREAVDDVALLDDLPANSTSEQAIDAQLRHWLDVYRSSVGGAIPLLDRAFAWLRTHLLPTGPTVVVHGDPGPGNALQDETGVAAVIDWEFAHVGDAAEDWAYLVLIRGRRLGTPVEWKARLTATVGVSYEEATWRAWETYNQVKGACVNLTALTVFRRSSRPTPDLLAIGVAVHLRFLGRALELIDEDCS